MLELKCIDFTHALALLNAVSDIAQSMGHHPDLGIRNYNELIISTTTHDASELTQADYDLAQDITDLIEYQENKRQIETYGRTSKIC